MSDTIKPASETMRPLVEAARHRQVAEAQREVPTSYGKTGVMNVPGYEDLAAILIGAYQQSALGKGKERHANDLPFNHQKIMMLARHTGIDAHTYQITKKALEAGDMLKRGSHQAAIAEFRGVIVYAAAAILLAAEIEQKSGQSAQN